MITLQLNSILVDFQNDTKADITVITTATHKTIIGNPHILSTNTSLKDPNSDAFQLKHILEPIFWKIIIISKWNKM